jgi:hypothetical protein
VPLIDCLNFVRLTPLDLNGSPPVAEIAAALMSVPPLGGSIDREL